MNDFFEKLNALADGELDAADASALNAQISSSNELKAQYESILKMKHTLRTQLPQHDSAELFAVCQARWREMDRAKANSAAGIVSRFRAALAGVVAMAIIGAGIINRLNPAYESGVDSLSKTLTASAANSFGFPSATDNSASEWANQQLGGQVPSPQASMQGLHLVRADRVEFNSVRAIRFVYTDGRVNYFYAIFPAQCADIQDLICENGVCRGTNGQLNFVGRVINGYLVVLAAPRPFSELEVMLPQ